MTTPSTDRKRRRFRGAREPYRVLLDATWQDVTLLDTIIEEAGRLGWQTMASRFFDGEQALLDFQPDGVLTCEPPDEVALARLRRYGCPVVRCGLGWPPGGGMPHVTEDSTLIGKMAAEHFLERRFENIGFVMQEPPHWKGSREEATYRGLQRRVQETGMSALPPLFVPGLRGGDVTLRQHRFAAWLDDTPRPVGILVWRDVFAGHVCAMCRQHGVAVPEEVAVLGIGNIRRLCKISPCPLSSIDPDQARHGREAAQLLQRLMQGDAESEDVIWIPPSRVGVRKSTDILAVADPAVARSLSFIWEHLSEPISVDDVSAAANMARRTLERRFRDQVGRTITQELLRKRLERCRELLLTTDLSVTDIAPSLGFLSKNYLHRAFRRKYGMSPGAFRAQHAGPDGQSPNVVSATS